VADQPDKKKKRIVKNPETFRERASKAAEAADKPNQSTKLKQATGKVTSPVRSSIRDAARAVATFKPLKPLIVVLRVIGRIIFPAYFRKSWRELRLVTWPNWKESRRLTFAVLVFAVIFGAVIAVVDYGLDKVFKDVLLK
jgi:preprotein translocase SecE subunit